MAGKGDRPRPIQDRKQFETNWDKIFGKKKGDGNEQKRQHSKKEQQPVEKE